MLYKKPHPNDVLVTHGNAVQTQLPRRFTVCVWNWQKCKQKTWPEEFNQIAPVVDLFLAQEVHRSEDIKKRMEQKPFHWSGAISFFSLKGHHPVGIATGCVAKPLRVSFAAVAKEPVFRIPKMTLATLIPIQNSRRPLLVVNLHAINFTGIKAFEHNLRSAAELLLDYNGPILLGGDFNCWNSLRRRLLCCMAQSSGLTEVTFDPDERSLFWGQPVDYLFVRGLKVLSTGVRVTHGSDHNPLLARLEIK